MANKERLNHYPSIFIHGFEGYGCYDKTDYVMHYWGMFRGDLMKHLRDQGYEVYNPPVGPFHSGWDRSCELYAILKGGTVDYGKVHSEKYGHARYGRTYPGILKDWGEEGPHKKINILGHSFGGPTVLAFSELLYNGSEEERAGTPADELSPLFEGGHDWLHTATTMSGVNNGTTVATILGNKPADFLTDVILGIVTAVANTNFSKWYDPHLDIWGVMDEPAKLSNREFRNPLPYMKGVKRYAANRVDNILHEMMVPVCFEINGMRKGITGSNAYYFCRRGNRTHYSNGMQLPNKNMCLLMMAASSIVNINRSKTLKKNYGFDKTWLPSDGLVNVPGQSAPLNQPSIDATSEDMDFKPGIWYNMPVEDKDHMSWMGYRERIQPYYDYFDNLMETFASLPDGEDL